MPKYAIAFRQTEFLVYNVEAPDFESAKTDAEKRNSDGEECDRSVYGGCVLDEESCTIAR